LFKISDFTKVTEGGVFKTLMEARLPLLSLNNNKKILALFCALM
jgi:hypothetical protein